MASQIIVFDRSGKQLAYLRGSAQRWWTLNEYGEAIIELSRNDPKVNGRIIREGNLVLIRHAREHGDTRPRLPDWAGVMDTPMEEDFSRGTVTVHAYSAEYLLTFRLCGKRSITLTGSAGANFAEIVAIANRAEDLLIRMGPIEDDGKPREDKLLLTNKDGLYDDMAKIAEDAGVDWGIVPVYDSGGRLRFEARMWKQRGRKVKTILNDKCLSGGGIVYSRKGKIINELTAVGDGANSSGNTVYYIPVDEASRALYGLRQGSEKFDAKLSDGTLKANGEARIKYWRYPRASLHLTVLDEGAAFGALDLGNTVTVTFSRGGGWSGEARITQMDYDDEENTIELKTDEVVT